MTAGEVTGRVHSFESFGTLDGPGVRFIVFLQGCPLRCCYCHNPDTWSVSGGQEYTVSGVMKRILACRSYLKSGGVTFSGGEPLQQREFLSSLLDACKEANLHTAIDTAGSIPVARSAPVIDKADMLLLDIKSLDDKLCSRITGAGNGNALDTLNYCEENGKDVWIRHVVVPGLTDDADGIKELSCYLKEFSCVKRVELLGYHKLGEYKWSELGVQNTLKDTPEPSKERIIELQKLFNWCRTE